MNQQKLMQALRNASAAAEQGDQSAAQDAQRLAKLLQQQQQATPSPAQGQNDPLGLEPDPDDSGRGTFDELARGIGSGITNILGLPVGAAQEVYNIARNPAEFVRGVREDPSRLLSNADSGAQAIRGVTGPLGLSHLPGEDPSATIPGAVGEAITTFGTPGALGSYAVGERAIRRGLTMGAARAPSATAGQRLLDDAGELAARHPILGGTSEFTGAAGAATGRELAENDYEEGSWQSGVAELIGGVAGGLTPGAVVQTVPRAVGRTLDFFPVARSVKNAAQRYFSLEPSGSARNAVQRRIQEVTDLRGRLDSPDPEVAEQASARLQELQRGLRGQDDSVMPDMLTPAQRAGDEGIFGLAARARADNPQTLAHWRSQADDNLESLRGMLQGLTGDVDPTVVSRMGQEQLDDMITVAAANAQRRVATLRRNGALTPAESSDVVQQELRDAYRQARQAERTFWQAVPEDMVMPAEAARNRYIELRQGLGEISRQDMPEVARRYMDPRSPESWLPPPTEPDVQDTVPLRRLQELRSALMDEAANASSGANPNRNRARLARQLAEGIRQDLDAVDPRESPGTGALVAARDYSRKLNDRFTRGVVGDALRMNPNRETQIPSEELLDRTLGRGGIRSVRTIRDFSRALEGRTEASAGAVNDYLNERFMRAAFREGPDGELVLQPAGAKRFMEKYQDVFKRLPAVRRRFEGAIDSGELDTAAMRVADGVGRVLQSGNPSAEVRKIKRLAPDTQEGKAVWEGFRRNLLTELNKGATRTRDGYTQFSGQSILTRLETDAPFRRAMEEAFTPNEMRRLRQIANTAARIEQDMSASPAARLTDAEPSMLNQIIARVGGARAGAGVDQALGGGSAGTSLQSAQIGSNVLAKLAARGVRDPQADLIKDALGNEQLLDSLLIPPRTEAMRDRFATIVNAWATNIIDRQDAQELGLDHDESLDTYIEDATKGLKGGKPTAADRRRMREMEREARLRPAAGVGGSGQPFQGPQIRGPEGPVSMGDALRGLPGPPTPQPNLNPEIRGGSRPGGTLSEVLRR